MPELPEVETIRRDLNEVLTGKKISKIEIRKAKVVHDPAATFIKKLTGLKIKSVDRRAKLLIISFTKEPDLFLLIHLKMTGQLIYQSARKLIAGGHSWPALKIADLPNKYSHVIISFADNSQLYFNDLRQFGYLKLVTAAEKDLIVEQYGIEPLTPNFTLEAFSQILARRSAPLKHVLLDQTAIAGLGNIYVDESCLEAGVRPDRPAKSLSTAEVERLFLAVQKIIKLAVKERGTTFNHYRDGQGKRGNFVKFLKAYGHGGETCPVCQKATLVKTKVAGRGTVYCPHCQI